MTNTKGASPSKVSVLFLDRDGTINVDKIGAYINAVHETYLIPGAGKAIRRAIEAGFKIAIITNQAGVAKGITPRDELPRIHRKLEELIAAEAGLKNYHFDDVRVCLHLPEENCGCRKPDTKMLEQSIEHMHADVARSFFVGDKISDLTCGARMNVRTIMVLTGHGEMERAKLAEHPDIKPAGIEKDLMGAVELAIRLRDQH